MPEQIMESRGLDRRDILWCVALATVVLLSRIAERGALYFVDGPRIVAAIQAGTYTVQSPGYWTFARLGGLFADPAAGLQFWNIFFSTLGVPVFYLLCRTRQAASLLCASAAAAYGFTYFVWFAGEIHSAYASQILFPPLAILCALRFHRTQRLAWVLAWSLAAAIGFALRPSDGVFLLPLWMYLLPRTHGAWRVWAVFFAVQVLCFPIWYLPTQHALQAANQPGSGALMALSFRTSSPLLGLHSQSLANITRVIMPSVVAFAALLPAIASRRRTEDNLLAAFWLIPGLLFFLLCYIADPTYMICICGAWFWLAVTSASSRRAIVCFVVALVVNVTIFLAARPIRAEGTAARLANFYVVKYCRYGIQHRWSSTLGSGGQVPQP